MPTLHRAPLWLALLAATALGTTACSNKNADAAASASSPGAAAPSRGRGPADALRAQLSAGA